jgi:SRSO17 transposase
MNARQLGACAERLQEFLTAMVAGVGRAERRHHGSLYVQGLLLDGEQKSIEPLARRVPGADVQAGCWGLAEQKIHLSRYRSSVRTRPASEISFRTDLQKA